MTQLTASQFETVAEASNALILDTRDSGVFAKGFIPQSINIGIKGDFAPWVGSLIVDVKQPILLVTEPGMEEESITRLSRVGFDNILGYLNGGFDAWKKENKEIDTVKKESSVVLDTRRESEYAAEHVDEAYSKPLAYINDWVKDINPKEHYFIHCAGGYRSMIAASILQARGYRNFSEVEGGFNAIAKTDVPRTDFICQSKVMKA
jgi:rhodanese-related sulfurtransferase